MASLSSYPTRLNSSSSSTSFAGTSTTPPLIPVPSSLKAMFHTSEKTTSTTGPSLTLPIVGTASPLPSQMRRVTTHRSPSPSSTSKLVKLAIGTQSVLAGTEPPPLSLDKDSLPITVSTTSSSSSALPAIDFKEGKAEAVSTSSSTSSSRTTRRRTSSTSTSTVVQNLPSTSLPKLPEVEIEIRESDYRANCHKKEILERQAHKLANDGHFQSALTCIKKIITIAGMFKVSCISVDRLEIEIRIKQLKHDMDERLIPILEKCIQDFFKNHPNEQGFVIYLLQQALNLANDGDFQSALAIIKIANTLKFSCISADRLEIEIRIKQFKHDVDERLIPTLKRRIHNFLKKYPVKNHPNEREFVVDLLKCRIEINCNDYNKTQLMPDHLQQNERDLMPVRLQIERDLRKLQDLLKELGASITENPFILTYQGVLYHFHLRIDLAYKSLQQALKLMPNEPFINTQLGLVCISSATQIGNQVSDGDPLTEFQIKRNKKELYKEAVGYFRGALYENKNNLLALRGSAYAYYQLGETTLAQEYVKLADEESN